MIKLRFQEERLFLDNLNELLIGKNNVLRPVSVSSLRDHTFILIPNERTGDIKNV